MISVTEYVILKMLLVRGEVGKDEVYSFIISKLPMKAGLVANASPYELYEEFNIIVSMLEEKGCVKRMNDRIVLINSEKCEKNIREYVRILENETEKVTPGLDGIYIAIVRTLVDQYITTSSRRGGLKSQVLVS